MEAGGLPENHTSSRQQRNDQEQQKLYYFLALACLYCRTPSLCQFSRIPYKKKSPHISLMKPIFTDCNVQCGLSRSLHRSSSAAPAWPQPDAKAQTRLLPEIPSCQAARSVPHMLSPFSSTLRTHRISNIPVIDACLTNINELKLSCALFSPPKSPCRFFSCYLNG